MATQTSDRLIPAQPTPTERRARATANRAAQGTLVDCPPAKTTTCPFCSRPKCRCVERGWDTLPLFELED